VRPSGIYNYVTTTAAATTTTTTVIVAVVVLVIIIIMVHTHMPKLVYEEGDVTVLWNQAVHTDREVTANRPDIIIKNKMHTDRCDSTCRQKCCAKGSGKEVKIQEFVYRDTTNVEHEMHDYTSNN